MDEREREQMNIGRSNYVFDKNKSNADILNDIALSDKMEHLTTMRHEFHCNYSSVFNSESSDNKEITEFLDDTYSIHKIGIVDILSDYDYYEDNENEYEDVEDAEEAAYIQYGEIHDKIECYIREFDKKNGTNYAPGGYNRIF